MKQELLVLNNLSNVENCLVQHIQTECKADNVLAVLQTWSKYSVYE